MDVGNHSRQNTRDYNINLTPVNEARDTPETYLESSYCKRKVHHELTLGRGGETEREKILSDMSAGVDPKQTF